MPPIKSLKSGNETGHYGHSVNYTTTGTQTSAEHRAFNGKEYDAQGRVKKEAYADGSYRTFSYNRFGAEESNTLHNSSGTIIHSSHKYYDVQGRVLFELGGESKSHSADSAQSGQANISISATETTGLVKFYNTAGYVTEERLGSLSNGVVSIETNGHPTTSNKSKITLQTQK
jgi:hypothetical protein